MYPKVFPHFPHSDICILQLIHGYTYIYIYMYIAVGLTWLWCLLFKGFYSFVERRSSFSVLMCCLNTSYHFKNVQLHILIEKGNISTSSWCIILDAIKQTIQNTDQNFIHKIPIWMSKRKSSWLYKISLTPEFIVDFENEAKGNWQIWPLLIKFECGIAIRNWMWSDHWMKFSNHQRNF